MIKEITDDAALRMGKCVQATQVQFAKLRTGRAHPSLLDHIKVEYYGSDVPLSQVANISVEDARTLSMQVFDKSQIQVVEKAIMTSDLGLNPNTAGATIRIALPPLTEERRRELVKVVRSEAEEGRIAIRNVRRDAKGDIKDMQKENMISEDEERRAEEQLQKITDKHIAEVDQLLEAKEKELLAV